MRDVARAAFTPLTVKFEGGYIDWMFPDVKKLISTGFGLLLDPVSLAIALPWKHPDGRLASRSEIAAEWTRLKTYVENNHGSEFRSYKTFASLTTLRLGRDGLDAGFQGKIDQMLGVLRTGFPEWDAWPADAQLGTMSMAWAIGPAFYLPTAGRNYWPKLTAALRRQDFRVAAVECFMNEEKTNPGIIPRNAANKLLFLNAAAVVASGNTLPNLKPDKLYWPTSVATQPPPYEDDGVDTIPELDAYRAEQVAPTVHAMPDTVAVCPKCQLASCDGSCPEAA